MFSLAFLKIFQIFSLLSSCELKISSLVCREWCNIIYSFRELNERRLYPRLYARPIKLSLFTNIPDAEKDVIMLTSVCRGIEKDTFIVSDPYSNRILVINLQGNLLKSIGNVEQPFAICVSSYDSHVLVGCRPTGILVLDTDYKQVRFINTRVITEYRTAYITTSSVDGNIFFNNCHCEIIVLNRDGILVRRFRYNQNILHYHPGAIYCNSLGDIIIADHINSDIKIFSPGGDHLRTISSRMVPLVPSSMVVDQYDNILLYNDSKILVFNARGEFIYKLNCEVSFEHAEICVLSSSRHIVIVQNQKIYIFSNYLLFL